MAFVILSSCLLPSVKGVLLSKSFFTVGWKTPVNSYFLLLLTFLMASSALVWKDGVFENAKSSLMRFLPCS